MHYQRARLCQRSRAERVGGFGLREWLGKAESQGYQAFPPLIMSQPPVVYVLAEPETATWPPFTPALIVNHMYTRALPFTM